MKNNKGVTLVALIVIIILLIIFSSVAIYSSMKSYEMIDLQKYKTQMQAIQNALDEFYEEYENFYKRNEDTFRNCKFASNENEYMELYLSYITSKTDQSFKEYLENNSFAMIRENTEIKNANSDEITEDIIRNWWNDYAPQYGITTDEPQVQRQYFGVSTTELESLLGLKDIDISEYFIINFQKRYVFSATPIEINTTKNENKTIYCLYELSDEEKIIEFKADNSSGKLEIEIIEKTLYYQIAKVTLRGQETTIKQIYYDDGSYADNLPKVESKKEFFEEVKGLGTNEAFIKINKSNDLNNPSYKFIAEDANGGICSGEIAVFLSEPPVLENNMIPFKLSDNLEAIICDVNDSEWYNYTSNLDTSQLAAVVLSEELYKENIGKSITGLFNGTTADLYYESTNENGFVVKLWIPYNKMVQAIEARIANVTNFINRTGIWVDAIWEDGKLKPVAHEHNWDNLTCQTIQGTAQSTCKRCGLIEYGIVKHDEIWVENSATCTASGSKVLKCSKCIPEVILETIEIPALGHDWIKDSVKDATCLANGSIEKHCSRCNEIATETVYATGHSYTSYTETAPSLTGGRGYYTYTCDNGCGETKKEWSDKELVLNANNFTKNPWTNYSVGNSIRIGNTGGHGFDQMPNLLVAQENDYDFACIKLKLDDVTNISFKFEMFSYWTNKTTFGISTNNTTKNFDLSKNKSVEAGLFNITGKRDTWEDSIDTNNNYNGEYYLKLLIENTYDNRNTDVPSITGYEEIRIEYK